MMGTATSPWLLTWLFLATGSWSLIDAVLAHPDGAIGRISCLWHALMSAAMVAMLWPWGAAVPPAVWTVLFVVGTARFAALALRRFADRADAAVPVCHAVMSAAMVAMVWTMPAMHEAAVGEMRPASAVGTGHHHDALTSSGTTMPGWLSLWCLANAVLLIGVAAFLVVGRVRQARSAAGQASPVTAAFTAPKASGPPPAPSGEPERWSGRSTLTMVADVAMALGMAVSFFQMA